MIPAEHIPHLPTWFNLKTAGAIILVGLGLWFLFKVLGEVIKILIALTIIGAGIFLLGKEFHWF
jgi:hypothetical protein